MPMKTEQNLITCATLLSMAAVTVFLLMGCASAPSGDAGKRGVSDDDTLETVAIPSTTEPQKIVIMVHPPGEHAAAGGVLEKHRVIVTFVPEDSHDKITVEPVSVPGETKKKFFKVVLSTPPPPPGTNTTGPHPIALTIAPGSKK